MGSVFGSLSSSFTEMMNEIKNEFKDKKIYVCDIGCFDGKHSFLIAKNVTKLDCYELNHLYIKGWQVIRPFLIKN